MIIAGTGHRPEDCEDEEIVRRKIRETLETARPDVVINGLAAGFDLWLADESIDLGIEVWSARPWADHGPRNGDAGLYRRVVEHSTKVVNVVDSKDYPGPWVYHKRNHWMVDHADEVVAYWSGKEWGGTYACIKYAKSKRKNVRNIYV